MRARGSFAVVFAVGLLAVVTACGGGAKPVQDPPPPPPLPASGVRFAIGGDSRDDKSHVLPWAFREAKARRVSAFIFLGDMELTPSLDGHFERALVLLDPVSFYPVLGNHEVKTFGFLSPGTMQSQR
jgi:hypothetical protein